MHARKLVCVPVMAAMAGGAAAQTSPYTMHIVVDPPVIEPGQTAMIELRAEFDGSRDYAMSAVLTSFLSSTGSAPLRSKSLLAPMNGPGAEVGFDTVAGIEGIIAGQINWPTADIHAWPTNPMPFWTVQYNTTTATVPQEVRLSTRTARFAVFECRSCVTPVSRMLEFEDGSAILRIVACRADFDEDGTLDLFDFLAFFNAFDAGDALADFDFDGALTVFDFLAFQNRFDQGC